MLLKINKYKKIIENKELFNILKNQTFFVICLKKNNSIKYNLELEKNYRETLNIKTLNKKSFEQITKKTIFKNMFNFLEGSVILIWPENNKIDIFSFLKKIEKIKTLNVVTCFFENSFYTLDNIKTLILQKKINEFNIYFLLKNQVKNPIDILSTFSKSMFFILKNKKD